MILFYIRHGDPIYNPDSLTELGKRQAEAVAKRLALYGIDRIYASTSNRAMQTAKSTGELTKKEIELLDFCNEGYAWKEFTVLDESEKRQWVFHNIEWMQLFMSREMRQMGENWYEHPKCSAYNFWQGINRINRETDAFLLSLGYEHIREQGIYRAVNPSEERVALFAHQGFGISFLSSLLDIPYPQFCVHFDMTHTGMTVIEFKEHDGVAIPKVLTMSNDSHIYREGLPLRYNNGLQF